MASDEQDKDDTAIRQVVQQSTHVPVPLRQHIQHTIEVIRRSHLTTEEILGLYQAVTSRMVNKTCFKCGRLKLEIEGAKVWPDGDMSKPKRFMCKDCL